jgi:hypothetical protein
MTHPEALEFLTRIGAVREGDVWTLTVGNSTVRVFHDGTDCDPWVASSENDEVESCFAADPQQALLDLGAELSDMATHCSSFGLALTRLAI